MKKMTHRLNNLFALLFILAYIIACFSMFIVSYLLIGNIEISSEYIILLTLTSIFSVLGFYYFIYINITLNNQEKIFEIKNELIEKMYQQFDDMDLTVFNAEYFELEDEVLNFILTQIPNWFRDCDAESLYDCIQQGYLSINDRRPTITQKRKFGALKVFYIKG